MKEKWIGANGLETPYAAALYGAPSRYGFYCTRSDGLFCFHNFHATYAAKKFLDTLIDGHNYKWVNKQTIITDHGLKIRGERDTDLEHAIEYEPNAKERDFEFNEPHRTMYARFAGVAKRPEPKSPAPTEQTARPPRPARQATPRPGGLINLADVCSELGIEPRDARATLRKSNTEKPAHGWAFTPQEVDKIKRILKGK